MQGKQLRVSRVALSSAPFRLEPGVVGVDAGRVWVGAADGPVELLSAQLEGKRELSARDLVNGRALSAGLRLGD